MPECCFTMTTTTEPMTKINEEKPCCHQHARAHTPNNKRKKSKYNNDNQLERNHFVKNPLSNGTLYNVYTNISINNQKKKTKREIKFKKKRQLNGNESFHQLSNK